jgi:hypothetical protein
MYVICNWKHQGHAILSLQSNDGIHEPFGDVYMDVDAIFLLLCNISTFFLAPCFEQKH